MLRKVKGGRAKAAALPKRSRVDDAYSDPDDAEIQRLEAKLGLKGTKKSKNAKLARALERVGMGTGLDGLFSSIEEMEERIESGLPPPEAGTSESDDDSDAPDVVSRQTAAAVVSEESNESESSIDDEATDDESEEGESEGEEPHVGPGVNTDGGGGLAAPSAGAWIPPHRRGLLKGD